MADAVSTGESSGFWEWGGDLVESVVGGWISVETEKAKNPASVVEKEIGNTANPNNTLTDAKQSQMPAMQDIKPLYLYIGGGVGLLILLIVLVFALRKRK